MTMVTKPGSQDKNPKPIKKTTKKRERHPWRQLVFRLFLLSTVIAVILAIGMARHGWQPFGAKTPRLSGKLTDKISILSETSEKKSEQTEKDILSQDIEKAVNEPDGTQEAKTPETPTPKLEKTPTPVPSTPTPTPTPKPETDKDKLKDFLDGQFN